MDSQTSAHVGREIRRQEFGTSPVPTTAKTVQEEKAAIVQEIISLGYNISDLRALVLRILEAVEPILAPAPESKPLPERPREPQGQSKVYKEILEKNYDIDGIARAAIEILDRLEI